ncbi:PQQ-binding-like beta-propeller repeat protein [Halobaculum limi]|uniref:outer membrane protein assembly factor BamB family protein n=1 Tax=Halobaculum limi TaxID=3031916 RepID=UPI0024060986|nr:PQQ-binding-like beta-propeller repeat protein [Halobaculum sp. YSMS11]
MPSRRAVLAGITGGVASSLAGCVGTSANATPGTDENTDWPMFAGNNYGTGYVPTAAAPRSDPTERFSVSLEGDPLGQPIVVDGRVFQSTWYGLEAFDAETGESLWTFRDEEPEDTAVEYHPPAVHDGVAYVGTEAGLVALDAASGAERWRVETEGRVSAPPIPGFDWTNLYVGTVEGEVLDVWIDQDSSVSPGTVEWRDTVYGEISQLVTPNAAGVIAGTTGGDVYALYNGRGLWRAKAPGMITAMSAEAGNNLYVATFGGGVLRLRTAAHAGRVRWHAEHGPIAEGSLIRAAGGVYGVDGGGLSKLGSDDGAELWTAPRATPSVPAAAGDTLFIGGEGGLCAYRLSGGIGVGSVRANPRRWTYSLEGGSVSGVSVADGAVFAGVSDDQRIVAVD